MATIYKADGSTVLIEPKIKYFSLKELQDIVGGYIEMLYLKNDEVMVLNEEGKILEMPVNVRATDIANMNRVISAFDIIVGDVLVCKSEEIQ